MDELGLLKDAIYTYVYTHAYTYIQLIFSPAHTAEQHARAKLSLHTYVRTYKHTYVCIIHTYMQASFTHRFCAAQ